MSLSGVEAAKRLAAYAAVDRHIGLEHKVGEGLGGAGGGKGGGLPP